MATSGTVGATVFTTRKVIEHAYQRCRINPEQLTPQRLQVAQDLLFLRLSALANKGEPLWAVVKDILPLYVGKQSVPTDVGTVNILNANLRRINRPSGTASSSEGVAANAFDGDFSTACVETLANGSITLQYASATANPMYGLLPNASGTWNYSIQVSNDGVTWTTIYTATAQAVVAGQWLWWDIEGVAAWTYYRLQASGGTILNVTELVFANTPTEINLGQLNRDDYSALPNKFLQGQPTSYWFDRQRSQPVITLWPSPGDIAKLWNLVVYMHRQVQDVGSLSQELELRQSAYLAVVFKLAADIAPEDKEVDVNLIPILVEQGKEAWDDFMDGESDDAPTTLTPNIGVYTR